MPYIDNLAAEILCEIFNSVTDSVDDGIIKDPTVGGRSGGAQVMGGIPTRGVIAPTSDAYKLPELKTTILAAFALSHVCKTWRKIVLERPAMWQRVCISYRQLLGLGKMLRTILVRSHPYPLHLDVSLLGCVWHLSGEVYTAARRQLDEFIMRCESVRVEGNHFALAALLKIFERHNLKARTKAGIKWLHVVENFRDANTNIPSGPFPLDRIAPQLICLNAQFAGASRFPSNMDRIIFEDHLFKREVYWDAFSISGAKHIVLSNVGIPRPYHRLGIMLGPLPPGFPGHTPYVSPRDKYLARTGSTLTSITFHALHDYRHERGCTIRAGDIMQHAAGQLFQEIFLKRVAATLKKSSS
ncbi:uncharacterized protein LACBIDRAFT_312399 [Laccaria bicolor S238N-H82]|uniref:Predicted protein n=1 Tax=Laccaria bicolor (strain S238N-H82 / ATCC MYA-4686) TaxID=486041 RepID=B0E4Z2_LACBS|nr:uncharacterized protein LACBIDRAFT_312399 [Laccaria bicolor S238N-H82]EDQ98089.1 predicted protein [Laccaria bicolor S238N-H82]|eukprot:XP_001891260.1 predicted protein [Laccaria bicolor S238N-H82]